MYDDTHIFQAIQRLSLCPVIDNLVQNDWESAQNELQLMSLILKNRAIQPVIYKDTPKPKGILDEDCCPHPPPLGTTVKYHIHTHFHL